MLQVNPIAIAQTSLTLAFDTISAYLELRDAAREAASSKERLELLFKDTAIANAWQNNPSTAVLSALANIERAAQALSDRANKTRSRPRWRQILFAKHYSAQLLKLEAALKTRVKELQVVLGVGPMRAAQTQTAAAPVQQAQVSSSHTTV